ncbi:unnamed protein product [Chironomus riparius]|uniref:ornithine decarboxylase n=1 Tax=Chironomus riparius TaxID=315576 RepID=A0A9N9S6E9_9DIPT|nr:unnamed protein product [Chironomus riparius]
MDILKLATTIIDRNHSYGIDDPFYILDLNQVKQKYQNWIENLPQIIPHYAVKCNDDENILNVLKNCGTGFDCASKNEIEKILKLYVDPSRIIFAHTVKQVSHLKFAAEKGVEKMTFDTEAELQKIKQFHPKAKVVLRIRFDAAKSLFELGSKFGAEPKMEARRLVKICKELELNLIGVSFHVGSGTVDYEVFGHAIDEVREIFDYAKNYGYELHLVDIGGGFMGHDDKLLKNYAYFINSAIERNFNDENIKIIAEPGQYFAISAMSIVTQIVLKKYSQNGHVHYFINDGVYGSFRSIYSYNQFVNVTVIKKSKIHENSSKIAEQKLSTIWGCTCSSRDKIIENIMMNEVEIGDWLIFNNMGAYSTVLSTDFNGFARGKMYYLGMKVGRGKLASI